MARNQDSLARLLDEALRSGGPVPVEHRGRRYLLSLEEAPPEEPPAPMPVLRIPDDPALKPLPIDLDELASIMDQRDFFETMWYLDRETGRLIMVSDDVYGLEEDEEPTEFDDDPRYLTVDVFDSHDSYRVMEDFIATVRDPRLRERLETAIQGRGAFRRFRDTLTGAERDRWHAYESVRDQQRAVDWLESEGIRPVPPVRSS